MELPKPYIHDPDGDRIFVEFTITENPHDNPVILAVRNSEGSWDLSVRNYEFLKTVSTKEEAISQAYKELTARWADGLIQQPVDKEPPSKSITYEKPTEEPKEAPK